MNPSRKIVKPRLAIVDGRVIATSLAVADHLGKDHWFVLTAIRNLECSKEFHESHFMLRDYVNAQGKRQPMYRMTRDGFAMLAVGFAGRHSKSVKNAYREAFQQLEASIGRSARFGECLSIKNGEAVVAAPAVFQFDGLNVRAFADEAGNPWFVAADVCEVLEHTNPSVAIARLDEDERAKQSLGRQGEAWVINESGLYNLIFTSNKPEAKRFRKWVTAEVLPTIRKTGRYEAPSPSAARQPVGNSLSNEEAFLRLYYAFDENRGPAMLLWCLMQMGAASDWIGPSVREIADASGGRISKSNVTRCAVNLKQRGLIDMKADLPWSRATYFVFEDAVMRLLQEVGKQLAGLPGIQEDGDGPLLLGLVNGTVH